MEIIFYIGLGLCILGAIGLLIAAFRTDILWGLAVLLIAPVAIIYLIVHWQDAKGPFMLQVLGLIIIVAAVYATGSPVLPLPASPSSPSLQFSTPGNSGFPASSATRQQFRCDGRQYCSQMRSRAEAEFFSRNCPGTKMDGDYDGIPCENDSRF